MIAVRYLALAALVIWVGGMIVLGMIVAPTVRVLDGAGGAGAATLAASVFGAALARFNQFVYVGGPVLLICLFIMKFVGPPPQAFVIRAAIVAAMLLVALYAGFPLAAEITRIQSQVDGPVGALPTHDPRRERFDHLHRTSSALMTVNTCLGLVLLFWYVKE